MKEGIRENAGHGGTSRLASRATIVCVLGMHRSGTSVTARLLNLAGLDLGPDAELMPAAADNIKGFWEHRGFVRINDLILRKVDGHPFRVPVLANGWERNPSLDELRERAISVIEHNFAGATCWGWKDPRTCLTLAFWQQLIGPMRYVLCFRHPAEVTLSLRERDKLSLARGLRLWLQYSLNAIRSTRGLERLLVFYEDIVADWKGELKSMASFIGKSRGAERASTLRLAEEFVDASMRHHVSETLDVRNGQAEGAVVRSLALAESAYAALRRDGPDSEAAERFLEDALLVLEPLAAQEANHISLQWEHRLGLTLQDLSSAIPEKNKFALVDQHKLKIGPLLRKRTRVPFPELESDDGSRPADIEIASLQLQRLRDTGVRFLAFAWPAFWRLEHHTALRDLLSATALRVLSNDRVIVFDLRDREPGGQLTDT